MNIAHARRIATLVVASWMAVAAGATPGGQAAESSLHRPLDGILDLYVRDGYVYYRALKTERARFDQYVASLDVPPETVAAWSVPVRQAFWLNAYNALVLKTVIDAYPIRGRSPDYPVESIRQIPGAFEKTTHRVAGRRLTLDQIEKDFIAGFGDPRLFLALGRGAVGSGRLRSEAFTGDRLDTQLDAVAAEFATDTRHVAIDQLTGTLGVSAIVGWREAAFVAAYDRPETTNGIFASRSPIERAVLAFVQPKLFPSERDYLSRNTFKVAYLPFDWSLNDLTGGRQ